LKRKRGSTSVTIYNVNTGAVVDAAIVQTPNRKVNYEGDAAIDGVPGTAAPVLLNFRSAIGSVTGKLLPTGNVVDMIDGVRR
jgi:2-methylaconitate cis-trans-isomerase PrpF